MFTRLLVASLLFTFSAPAFAKTFTCTNTESNDTQIIMTAKNWTEDTNTGRVHFRLIKNGAVFVEDRNAQLADSPEVVGMFLRFPGQRIPTQCLVVFHEDWRLAILDCFINGAKTSLGAYTCVGY